MPLGLCWATLRIDVAAGRRADEGVPLEVIRVRDEAPSVRSGEQLVARPGISDYLAIRIDRVPVQGREDGMLAELAKVDLERRPRHDVPCDAVGDDRVGEVISHRGAVRHVDRLSSSDREERPEAEIGHAFHIAIRVQPGVLLDCGRDGGSHGKDSGSFAGSGQRPRLT